jgi:hypothetical protein
VASPADFANGVFLGPIASLTFDGPFALSGRQMTFDHTRLNLWLGPWKFSFPLKKDAKEIKDMDDQWVTTRAAAVMLGNSRSGWRGQQHTQATVAAGC